ncbi:MAG TPA: DUF2279 domain-containing protein [Epsilonproteobacteria bacterium]|nr:DUF2279 domain-containing protein [Campylobacterota bacterium]
MLYYFLISTERLSMIFKQTLFLFTLFYSSILCADWITTLNQKTDNINHATLLSEDPTTGLIIDHLAADAVITAWGFKNWKWGTRSFHFETEDWFQYDSDTGGSDKTGHFYMTYLLSRILSSRIEDRGWDLEKSSLAGSLSSMLAMTLLEVGDGTSNYGFSKEDLLSDGLGALSAYLIRSNPKVDDFLDIRLEYLPTTGYFDNPDTTTDYSGMKHLVAFKLSGFESLKESPLRFVELQAGFYARGYRSYDVNIAKSQQIYVGIGLNLSELANMGGINILKNLFEFYQPGHTYTETKIWHR